MTLESLIIYKATSVASKDAADIACTKVSATNTAQQLLTATEDDDDDNDDLNTASQEGKNNNYKTTL